MKKLFILIFTFLFSLVNVYSQKNDTLVYQTIADFRLDTAAFIRYNFVDRAQSYEGETFSKLMDDLNIRPILIGIGYSFSEEGNKLFSGIRLYIPSNGSDRCYIHLSWIEPKQMPVKAERLLRRYGMYKWIDEYLTLFADNRIAYIRTSEIPTIAD